MSRPFTPKVVTANHLIEGDVIYWSEDNAWVRRHGAAALVTDEVSANRALAAASVQENIAVGVMLADAIKGDAGPEPVHFREAFRAVGPSNYFHGKQAEVTLLAGE